MTLLSTIWATQPVYNDNEIAIWLRFDAGFWELASIRVRNSEMAVLPLNPEAMDALCEAWPNFKERVAA